MSPEKSELTSKYDPTRKTVGAIYRDAQIENKTEGVIVGDMSHELAKSLVEDLNKTIESDPYEKKPFYITVHEKRELHMKNCFSRRLITTLYRPYPEDDTTVFHVEPSTNTVLFCWCLPHWSDMDNILNNSNLYPNEYVQQIRSWKAYDLTNFGFKKDEIGNWVPNEHYKDSPLKNKTRQPLIVRSQ